MAYNIGPGEDMEELHRKWVSCGWRFMTGVLTYRDSTGAGIRQMLVASQVPYGPFSELVQRIHGPSGQPFDGFDTTNLTPRPPSGPSTQRERSTCSWPISPVL